MISGSSIVVCTLPLKEVYFNNIKAVVTLKWLDDKSVIYDCHSESTWQLCISIDEIFFLFNWYGATVVIISILYVMYSIEDEMMYSYTIFEDVLKLLSTSYPVSMWSESWLFINIIGGSSG